MKKKVILLIIFLIKYIELFCSLCYFNDGRCDKKHRLIEINKNSLKDNDISYEKIFSEFDENYKKLKISKEKIEEEIEEINNIHKKIMDEITISFEEQRFRLSQKEKKLKSELDLKVTDIKEYLEKFLDNSNKIILLCERTSLKIMKKKKIIMKLKHYIIYQKSIKIMKKL